MRGTQLARQWKILRLLESRKRGLTVAELSSELDVPPRTVYRDLEAVQEAGFPLYTEREGRSSYWRLVDGFTSSLPLPFTVTELMALHMSRGILRVFDGTVFQESIESLFDKVKTSLPADTIRYLERISQRVTVGFGPAKDHEAVREIISQVSEATGKRNRVEISYKAASTGKETTRKIDPYQVWAMNGGVYLIALCHLRNSVRTFALGARQEALRPGRVVPLPRALLLGRIPADGLPGHAGRSQDREGLVFSRRGPSSAGAHMASHSGDSGAGGRGLGRLAGSSGQLRENLLDSGIRFGIARIAARVFLTLNHARGLKCHLNGPSLEVMERRKWVPRENLCTISCL